MCALGNKEPCCNHQSDNYWSIEIKDHLPAEVLHDKCTIQWAKHTSSFRHCANDTQCQGAPPLSIEIADNRHSDGHDGATTDSLDEAGCDQPHQTGRGCIDMQGT